MRRIAVIEKEKCNPEGCGGYLCIRVSPGNRMGRDVFVVGEDGKAQVNEDVCTDAESITVKKCPFGAIHMVKLPEKLTADPIHRFGKDGFALFSMPVPLFGKVNGILGINGIGKSTAVKVLAQVLTPNFGGTEAGADGKGSADRLIQMFKGTEAQAFFEKMKEGRINVSLKPQAVDAIPATFKGTAEELLQKMCSDRKEIIRAATELGIQHVLGTAIGNISGGELQRLAIAAAVLKQKGRTNVYIFDEPTSYLDIKQRIKLSGFIREMATAENAVVAVEHDLIILDHMADSVHIMYGEAGAYGMVSQPKPARSAINTYLAGYLKDENMRFRQREIRFASKPPKKSASAEVLVSWEGIRKKLGLFELSAAEGRLPKKHVVGVLGENGTGKTSFVRILAGEIRTGRENLNSSVSFSYKPQYIHAAAKGHTLAEDLLEGATADAQILSSLSLEPLLQRKVKELSGGELQRMMVARCLSQDADLYLIDEPSAYLDVEQRIAVSKLIRERMDAEGKTALVVDHDLLLIDYVSDMLMIFEGQPGIAAEVKGPFGMEEGMNMFLQSLKITLRRDKESNRPRINSPGSRLDRAQKSGNKYYYSA